MTTTDVTIKPVKEIRLQLETPAVREQFDNVLGKESGAFVSSVIDLYNGDKKLQKCKPAAVIMECLKAASLKLPINKSLGFAYVIPYDNSPQFQIGYKGIIQLALRTGQFKYLNEGIIYDGQTLIRDQIRGTMDIQGEPKSDKAIGYFCYMELNSGYQKSVAITRAEAEAHGKKFSKTFANGPWKTDFDAMALKTVVKKLSKYFPMTIEMSQSLEQADEDSVQLDIDMNANTEEIIDAETRVVDKETGEIESEEAAPY